MGFIGFNTGSGVMTWYSMSTIKKIAKSSSSKINIYFSNEAFLEILFDSFKADEFMELIVNNANKKLEIDCSSVVETTLV